ncbi:MAG: extracellular solute-binding protein [Proteobacteria bacterium]|nr:extracellular solute-binding protein [Pseudomonadota bacterium]
MTFKGMSRRELAAAMAAVGVSVVTYPLVNRPAAAEGQIAGHTWAGYDLPELMGSYLAQYGEPPEFSYIASDNESFEKIRAGFAPDFIHPGSYIVRRYVDAELVQPIDTSRLSNWATLAPGIKDIDGAVVDGTRYFVPAEFGNSSLLYRTDMVDEGYLKENSWAILYDDAYAGKMAWYDSSAVTVAVAALMKGYDNIWTLSDDELADVATLMAKQRDLTLFYWSDVTQMEQAIAAGEIAAAYSWNQSFVQLQQQGLPVGYMVPKEGVFAWGSGFVIHKDASDLDAVYSYIDAWISPESGAWLIDNYGYGSANLAAYDLLSPERLGELGFADPETLIANTIFFPAMEPAYEAKYETLYQDVRAGA